MLSCFKNSDSEFTDRNAISREKVVFFWGAGLPHPTPSDETLKRVLLLTVDHTLPLAPNQALVFPVRSPIIPVIFTPMGPLSLSETPTQ